MSLPAPDTATDDPIVARFVNAATDAAAAGCGAVAAKFRQAAAACAAGRQFIDEFYAYADEGFVGHTPIAPDNGGAKATTWAPVVEADRLFDMAASHYGIDNVYFRLTTVAEPPATGRGGGDITLHGYALPIDFDGQDGWTWPMVQAALRRLVEMGLYPTVVIDSGHGWHGYLFYDEPVEMFDHMKLLAKMQATMVRIAGEIGRTALPATELHRIRAELANPTADTDVAALERATTGLVEVVEGRKALKVDTAVYDSGRIMRLPNSLNVNKGDRRPCFVMAADYTKRHSWSDLNDRLDEPPKIERTPRPAIGTADDEAVGSPGRELVETTDPVDGLLYLLPGFEIVKVDSDGATYIARPDRGSHGIVVYADGHIAIYSGTTRETEMHGIPGDVKDTDREAPWNIYQVAARVWHGGTLHGPDLWSATAKDLAAGRFMGRKFGSGARAADEMARQQAELMTMVSQPARPHLQVVPEQPAEPAQAAPQPDEPAQTADEPAQPASEPADGPTGEQVGAGAHFDAVELLHVFGFSTRHVAGMTTLLEAKVVDGGASVAANVTVDGMITFGPAGQAVIPVPELNARYGWVDALRYGLQRLNVDIAAAWPTIVSTDEPGDGTAGIIRELRHIVRGVPGVGGDRRIPWGEREELRNPVELLPEPNLDRLPDVIRSIVDGVAGSAQVPRSMVLGTVLGALSSAVCGRLVVRTPKWDEPVVLYVVNVAESGARKSPVFNAIFGPLKRRQADLAAATRSARIEAEHFVEVAKMKLAAAKKEAASTKNAASTEERQNGIIVAQRQLDEAEAKLQAAPVLFADDVTPERLGQLLAEQGGQITIASDEPAAFSQMVGKYRDGSGSGKAAVDSVWLAGYSAGDVSVQRVGRDDVHVNRAGLTLALFSQPRTAYDMVQNDDLRDRGLHARCLWILNRPLTGRRLTGDDVPDLPECDRLHWTSFITMLAEYASTLDRWTPLALSAEAWQLFTPMWARIEASQRSGEALADLTDWGSKAPGMLLRLAALMHAANHPMSPAGGEIDGDEMQAAIELYEWVEANAVTTYTEIGAVLGHSRMQQVVDVLAEQIAKQIKRAGFDGSGTLLVDRAQVWRDLNTSQRRKLFASSKNPKGDPQLLEETLDELAGSGWVRRHVHDDQPAAGRPKADSWEIHPDWLAAILDRR